MAKAAKGRVAVLAGVSECGTRLVIENIKRAEEAGADAIVTTMPYYFPTTSIREQIEFTEDVTASTKLPVLLYNIPPVTGYSLNEELLDHVCDIDNLYGIKDSSGKAENFLKLKERYGEKLKIFVGAEELNYFGLKMARTVWFRPWRTHFRRCWRRLGRRPERATGRHARSTVTWWMR